MLNGKVPFLKPKSFLCNSVRCQNVTYHKVACSAGHNQNSKNCKESTHLQLMIKSLFIQQKHCRKRAGCIFPLHSTLQCPCPVTSFQFKSLNTFFFLQCRAGSVTSHSSSNEQPQAELRNRGSDIVRNLLFLNIHMFGWVRTKALPQKKLKIISSPVLLCSCSYLLNIVQQQ